MNRRKHTKEEFDHIIKVHDDYLQYVRERNLENGQVKLAYEYIAKNISTLPGKKQLSCGAGRRRNGGLTHYESYHISGRGHNVRLLHGPGECQKHKQSQEKAEDREETASRKEIAGNEK